MEMEILYPGRKRVRSAYNGYSVDTDQPKKEGGNGTAPTPFDLFLASIGTCAGFYILSFCDSRKISTENIRITLRFDRNKKSHLMEKIDIDINLPDDFPDKYRQPVIRAAEKCTVKRNILHPPIIQVNEI
jgi:ribosomal protein S12 methylthiotransferase accessory factor